MHCAALGGRVILGVSCVNCGKVKYEVVGNFLFSPAFNPPPPPTKSPFSRLLSVICHLPSPLLYHPLPSSPLSPTRGWGGGEVDRQMGPRLTPRGAAVDRQEARRLTPGGMEVDRYEGRRLIAMQEGWEGTVCLCSYWQVVMQENVLSGEIF